MYFSTNKKIDNGKFDTALSQRLNMLQYHTIRYDVATLRFLVSVQQLPTCETF
jgi:hypothetical protein